MRAPTLLVTRKKGSARRKERRRRREEEACEAKSGGSSPRTVNEDVYRADRFELDRAFSRVLPPRGLCTPLRQKTSKIFLSSFPTVFFRMEHIIERIYIDSCRMSRRTSIIIERNRGFCHVDDSMTNYRGVFGL